MNNHRLSCCCDLIEAFIVTFQVPVEGTSFTVQQGYLQGMRDDRIFEINANDLFTSA